MPKYAYTVRDKSGQVRTGVSEAEDEIRIKRRLEEQGFAVLKVSKVSTSYWPLILTLLAVAMAVFVVWAALYGTKRY